MTADLSTTATAALLSPQVRLRPGEHRAFYHDSPAARERVAEASEAVGLDLATALLHGQEAELNRGAVARPLIVALSVAYYHAAVSAPPDYLAGLSLGQITAAHLAGCLSFADAARMAHTMASLEAEEFDGTDYGVYFYSAVDPDRLLAAAAELDATGHYLRPCAFVADDQVIMTGTQASLARLAQAAFALGGAGVVIPYGPPAHCALMAGVRYRFETSWAPRDPVADPHTPLICNLTAEPLRTGEAVLSALVDQYTTAVRWVQSMRTLAALGVRRVTVPGPGAFIARSLRSTAVPLQVDTGPGIDTPSPVGARP